MQQRELPRTCCRRCTALGQSKCNLCPLGKHRVFSFSPSLTQDIKPQESRHFSQNPKIFHFETPETAKLKFQRGCTPSMWSLRHIFHRENLNKVDTFPQSASAPSKPALPSRKNHPAESLPPGRGSPKVPRSRDTAKRECCGAPENISQKTLPFSQMPPCTPSSCRTPRKTSKDQAEHFTLQRRVQGPQHSPHFQPRTSPWQLCFAALALHFMQLQASLSQGNSATFCLRGWVLSL